MDGTDIGKLQPPGEYRESRAHIFRSRGSWDWFYRKHRDELVEAGAIVAVGGQQLLDPQLADRVVVEVGRRAAAKAAGEHSR